MLYPETGRMRVVNVRLDAAAVKHLRRLGDGYLSAGIRKAAESHRYGKYQRLEDAVLAAVEAYDLDQDMGPAIDGLIAALYYGRRRIRD